MYDASPKGWTSIRIYVMRLRCLNRRARESMHSRAVGLAARGACAGKKGPFWEKSRAKRSRSVQHRGEFDVTFRLAGLARGVVYLLGPLKT
eukprot:7500793-Pyramimonas_sp.AAC.1